MQCMTDLWYAPLVVACIVNRAFLSSRPDFKPLHSFIPSHALPLPLQPHLPLPFPLPCLPGRPIMSRCLYLFQRLFGVSAQLTYLVLVLYYPSASEESPHTRRNWIGENGGGPRANLQSFFSWVLFRLISSKPLHWTKQNRPSESRPLITR